MSAVKYARKSTKKSHRRSSQWPIYLISVGVGIAFLVLIVFLVQNGTRLPTATTTLMGDEITVTSRQHIPVGTPPNYSTNPPVGGDHYPTWLDAKFYQESDVAGLPQYPQGYLVHNEEHGYVIFWYNCNISGVDCASLKQSIQKVMNAAGGTKLIAFPWSTMDVPLAITSWGRLLKLKAVDEAVMSKFIASNRYQAPEPDGG